MAVEHIDPDSSGNKLNRAGLEAVISVETYDSSGAVYASISGPDAVEPLGLPKLPETIFLHGDCRNAAVLVSYEEVLGPVGGTEGEPSRRESLKLMVIYACLSTMTTQP